MLDLGSVACTRPQTVRVLTPAGPQSQAGAEGAHPGRRGLRAAAPQGERGAHPPAGREDGSRCWVSVGTSEFSGHLELVHLGGVIYVISALAAGCLIIPRPTGLPLPALASAAWQGHGGSQSGRAGRRGTVFGVTSREAEQRSGKNTHSESATPKFSAPARA